MRSTQLHPTDLEYIDGHRWMYGELGERAARAALLARDKLMRPSFVLPRIRLAPVAPYGKCLALACHSPHGEAEYTHGVWVFLHVAYHGTGEQRLNSVDTSTLHELLHVELFQAGRNPDHNGDPWAERCQEMSDRLGLDVRIERPRSIRYRDEHGKSRVKTATPDGCLPYDELARWPRTLLNGDGPSLRDRMRQL